MTDKEAMAMALDALETEVSIDWTNNDEFNASAEKMHEAITALKERLAQPKQEPFAIVHIKLGCIVGSHRDQNKLFPDGQYGLWPVATPPAVQRKPLTDQQYFEIGQRHWLSSYKVAQIHKEIDEAAHGIKENT
jgi:hypothetical protein